MDLDDSLDNVPKGFYIDALNITKNAESANNDLSATNIVGNRLVTYTLPAGTNITIGAKADVLRNRVFEFIWNSNDLHLIVIYDNTSRIRTKLIENLTDSNDVDVLQFTRYNKIIHVDIIYRGEDEGDLMYWTDGNVTPRKCNIKHIQEGDYTYIKIPFIEMAKMPPIQPIQAVYGTDATRNANSLRKKLIQSTYRWSYDDFEKSTFTTYSKIPLPIGYYGSDNDIDSAKNNFITLTVETGDENVTDIEIAVRFNIESNWGDFVLVTSLNKEQLGIPDNSTYDYLFYNDGVYPPLEVEEVIQLFDWVPQKAKSQCSANGNTIEYGAITESYDNYPVGDLDVTITATNIANNPPDATPASITYIQSGGVWTFSVLGSVVTGTRYRIIAQMGSGAQLADYTSVGGDTTTNVAAGLYAYIVANHPTYAGVLGSNTFTVVPPTPGFVVLLILVDVPSGGGTISTEKTWLWDANYILGQGYKDEQGRLMPGITTKINPVDTDNDYLVTTPAFSLDGSFNVETPVITAEINHLPMDDAVTFAWSRRRMTYANFIFYETCDYQSDANFLYFCLANIEKYKTENSQFIYSTAPIFPDSRIKIIAGITSNAYDGDIWDQDYEILGTVTRTLTGGTSPADDKLFIKVKKPIAAISPAYSFNMLAMVYTPMANPTSIADAVYWEWGEEYGIYEGLDILYSSLTGTFTEDETVTGGTSGATGVIVSDDGTDEMTLETITGTFVVGETITGGTSAATSEIDAVTAQKYHRGMTQDQTSTQPAIYVWEEGDVYFHQRTMPKDGITTASDTVSVMDSNWSDFFNSAVNDNGRGLAIEVNGRRTYFPATIRFSLEYQQNTNINQTNRFKYQNFIDLDRSFGDIFKMSIMDRYIRIGQRFKIGAVPIFNQISKDANNSTLLASTDILLNPVQYFQGEFGVGEAPEAWTDFNFSSYFFDTNRGIWCRLSRDGITPISVLYKINSWATSHGTSRVGNFKIYGTYDSISDNCIFAFEEVNIYALVGDLEAFTINFVTNDIILFYQAVAPGIRVTLNLTANNGDAQTVFYDTVQNETTISLRNNLISILNSAPGTLFNGVATVLTTPISGIVGIRDGTNLFGLIVNNLLGGTVSSSVTFVGNLLYHDDAHTISFSERTNSFESFLSYHPEMMVTLGKLLISFKDGQLYTHDSDTYNQFYGFDYPSYITAVFNQNPIIKKSFVALTQGSNTIWTCPEITTQVMSYGTTPQQSNLIESDFEDEEGQYNAALLRDSNSADGLINGDDLKGKYIIIKFYKATAPSLVTLEYSELKFIESPLNSR